VKIIAGLGNPGVRYRWSRHNIGFQVVDQLARDRNISAVQKRFNSLFGSGWIDSEKVLVLKPLTFMNLSGGAVRKAIDFFGLGTENLIVVHDDLDLSFGALRIKRGGGSGGHQGIRSIIESLGTGDFPRLKIGIGRPPPKMEAADYVLASFEEDEKSDLGEILQRASEALVVMLTEGLDVALNRCQGKERVRVTAK
jgi:peptidyl-tRNA hydrolase, PTH1 family